LHVNKFSGIAWIPVPFPVIGHYNELKLSLLLSKDRLRDEKCSLEATFKPNDWTKHVLPPQAFIMIKGYT